MTGGRILRSKNYIDNETFMLTYGDGVADINIKDLIQFHKQHGKIATMTTIQRTENMVQWILIERIKLKIL